VNARQFFAAWRMSIECLGRGGSPTASRAMIEEAITCQWGLAVGREAAAYFDRLQADTLKLSAGERT
jgi:hypothetical protein